MDATIYTEIKSLPNQCGEHESDYIKSLEMAVL
jgi:hypothetical protein